MRNNMETRQKCYLNSGYNNQNDTFESVDNMDEDEGYQFDNEMYVDDEEIINKLHNIDSVQQENMYVSSPFRRCSPIGQSIRQYDSKTTLLSITPQKHNYNPMVQKHTRDIPRITPKRNIKIDRRASYSVPNRRNSNLDVLAPMIAQAASNQNSALDLRRTMSIAGISQYREAHLRRNQSACLVSPNMLPRNQKITRSARVINSRRRLNMNSIVTSNPIMRHNSFSAHNSSAIPLMENSLKPVLDELDTTFSVKNVPGSTCGSQYSTSKSMAVISPTYRPTARITSTPIKMQTITDEEDTRFFRKSFSPNKNQSWIRTAPQHLPVCSLFLASSILAVSGIASFLMAFYLMSLIGRTYYLNVGVFSGTVSMTLGMLGFRFRDWEWLPNRNYVSGFILISLFSVIHMLGLLLLIENIMTMNFETMDVIGGALCCVSVISALIASFGLITSCCCKYPPPDNRVAHGVEGFRV